MSVETCGVKNFMGCNQPIETVVELYRCVDCGIAFHKSCILAHFTGAHRPHPLRETQLAEALAEKEREINRLKFPDVSKQSSTT